eukprot:TRINITY_DN11525_c4_g4_i1.p1 TRINITY_DN11525_c4_g4~~TRINITY_DN11525_c4_g4_i1.p1  ORF type:complete len:870 (+),score=174.88 TRINITY_DN11525_c4_g4_i1:3-2612(+)
MLSLVAFLKYNLGTAVMLLGSASAYPNTRESLANFNASLTEYGLTKAEAEALATIMSDITAKSLTDQQLVRSKPAIHCRILQAKNLENILSTCVEFVQKHGLDDQGYLNVMLVVDEAHNLFKSQDGTRLRLEEVFRGLSMDSYKENLRYSMQMHHGYQNAQGDPDAVKIEALLKMIDDRGWHIKSLFKVVAFVTATVQPLALKMERGACFLKLRPPEDYFGFSVSFEDGVLPAERGIQLKQEGQQQPDYVQDDVPRPLQGHEWVINCMDEKVASDQQEHVLLYVNGSNAIREDIAQLFAERYEGQMVVILCLFGRSKGYGQMLLFTDTSACIAEKINEADRQLHCNKDDLPEAQQKRGLPQRGDQVFTKIDYARRRFFPPYGGHLNEAILKGKALVDLNSTMVTGVRTPVVRLPSQSCYRDRVCLNLVQAAAELAGIEQESITIITIGKDLMKEGVTLKTSNHKFAPTAMFLAVVPTDDVTILQSMGRLAGRNHGGTAPSLHGTKAALDALKHAAERSRMCEEALAITAATDVPPVKHLSSQPGRRHLADPRAVGPQFNRPLMASYFGMQSTKVSQYHSSPPAQFRARVQQAIDGILHERGLVFTKANVKSIANRGPVCSDLCEDHIAQADDFGIDDWLDCRGCLDGSIKRIIAIDIMKKRSKQARFFRTILKLGYHAAEAELSCAEGWYLRQTHGHDSWTWEDVGRGLGFSSGIIKSAFAAVTSSEGIFPLKRAASDSSMYVVPSTFLPHGYSIDDIADVDNDDLYAGLNGSDEAKLRAYLGDVPMAAAHMPTVEDAQPAGSPPWQGAPLVTVPVQSAAATPAVEQRSQSDNLTTCDHTCAATSRRRSAADRSNEISGQPSSKRADRR